MVNKGLSVAVLAERRNWQYCLDQRDAAGKWALAVEPPAARQITLAEMGA